MTSGTHKTSLVDALSLSSPACVALIGGGGKTTTLLALQRDLESRGARTTVTTTTRMWPPDDIPILLLADSADWNPPLDKGPSVVIGQRIGEGGKLHGIAADLVCTLLERDPERIILVEADGAAGRPLKVHGPHEPVVPDCATLVLVVLGLDVLNQPADSTHVHRLPQFLELTGLRQGERVTVESAATAALASLRHVPCGARVAFLINKVEGIRGEEEASSLRAALVSTVPALPVILTYFGLPVPHVSGPTAEPSVVCRR